MQIPGGTGIISAIRDVSKRKAEEDKFRALLESAPDAMVIVDGSGKICSSIRVRKSCSGIRARNCWGIRSRYCCRSDFTDDTFGIVSRMSRTRNSVPWAQAWNSSACARTAASFPLKSVSALSRLRMVCW